jgi:hypothetical protein
VTREYAFLPQQEGSHTPELMGFWEDAPALNPLAEFLAL